MEHAQRVDMVENEGVIHYVLILILMEHAQRGDPDTQLNSMESRCLNPYFNGTCSKRQNGKGKHETG